jgi:hypothetical protein
VDSNSVFYKIDPSNAWIIIRQLCRLYDCNIIYIRSNEEYLKLDNILRNIPLFANKSYILYIYCNDLSISSILSQIPFNNFFVFTNNDIDYSPDDNFIYLDSKVNINNNIPLLLELYLLDKNIKINIDTHSSSENYLSFLLHKLELLYISDNGLDNKEVSSIIYNKKVDSFSKIASDIYNQNDIAYTNYVDPLPLAAYIQRIAINRISRTNSTKDENIIKILFQVDSYIKKYPEYGLFIVDQHIKTIC